MTGAGRKDVLAGLADGSVDIAIGTHALELSRIEAGFLAAYMEFLPADETVRTGRSRSPLELGLDWLVDFKKPNFNGRRALAEEKRAGSTWRLVKLDISGNKPAHNSYIYAKEKGNRSEIGFITSAAWSPVCKQYAARHTRVLGLGGGVLPARDALESDDGESHRRRQAVLVPATARSDATWAVLSVSRCGKASA